MKKTILFMICILFAVPIMAKDFTFKYEGQILTYTILNETNKTCKLGENSYIFGNLIIPEKVVFNNLEYSVTEIGPNALRCCGITSVTIPNSVTEIDDYAFYGCGSLTTIIIPNSVTFIGYKAFSDCDGLTSVTIGDSVTNGDSVTIIGSRAFLNCRNLSSLTIGNSVKEIDDEAFTVCKSLKSITIPNSVTIIGKGAFRDCEGITSIDFGNSVSIIESSAFSGCSGITSLTIPNSVTEIGPNAFSGCNITTVTIPNSVTKIWGGIFYDCNELYEIKVDPDNKFYTSIDGVLYNLDVSCIIQYPNGKYGEYIIPNSIDKIESGALGNCKGITSLTIPHYLSVDNYAFGSCSGLTEVNYTGDQLMSAYSSIFSSRTYRKATLYVKESLLSFANEIDPWRNFINIKTKDFSGLEDVVEDVETFLPINIYNLNGIYVGESIELLPPGIYIVKKGSKSKKISVK